MKLYYSDVLNPRKACAVARHLQSTVEFVFVDLAKGEQRAPAHLAVNPNGQVPTLVDGERIVLEADAIMCHLSERAGADLWPHEIDRQIDVVRWLSWNHQHFNRHGGELYFQYVIKSRFGLGPEDPVAVDQAIGAFRRYAAVLNGHLAGRRWLLGDRMTVADFSVAGVLPYAQASQMPLNDFPEVRRWHEQLNELEAWREPFPARA